MIEKELKEKKWDEFGLTAPKAEDSKSIEKLPDPGTLATQFCERDLMSLQLSQEKFEKVEARLSNTQLQLRFLQLEFQEMQKARDETVESLWKKYGMSKDDSVSRETGIIARKNNSTAPAPS